MITARDRRLFFYGIIALFGFIFAIVVLGVVVVKMDHSVNGSITVTSSNTRLGTFRFAAVAAPHKKCSEIGTKILARGGSAVDSAIAASVCVSIFNMQSAGIGGGFLMTAWINKDQKAYVLDAREQAPLQSHENMFSNTNDASISSVVGAQLPSLVKLLVIGKLINDLANCHGQIYSNLQLTFVKTAVSKFLQP